MAVYTTIDALKLSEPEANLIQLTDGTTTPVTAKIDEAILFASTTIDSFLSGAIAGWGSVGYVISPIINHIAVELSIYNLYMLKFGSGQTQYSENPMFYRYKNAMDMLTKIRDKKMFVGDTERTAAPIKVIADEAVFSAEKLAGF